MNNLCISSLKYKQRIVQAKKCLKLCCMYSQNERGGNPGGGSWLAQMEEPAPGDITMLLGTSVWERGQG